MSADTHVVHAGHAAGHGHGSGHGSLRSYLIGFGLSVVLTAIPFWLVMSGVLDSRQATAFTIMVFAAAQIVVHMIFFLHMKSHLRYVTAVMRPYTGRSCWIMMPASSTFQPRGNSSCRNQAGNGLPESAGGSRLS